MEERVDELLPTRQSLILRLRNWDDQESWRDFFNTYWKLIYGVAIKSGLSDAAAQDVVQDTIVSLATSLRDGRYDSANGSFKNWLFTVTRRRIADHFRRAQARPTSAAPAEDSSLTPLVNRIPDPASINWESVWDEEWEKNLMDAALANVKRRVKPLQYQLFDCLVFKNWPVSEIKQKLRVSMHQVYFAKAKISRMIEKEITRLRRELR
jgi:RNA polymerase sigma-70 factor (ECF subfamily)